MRAGFFETDVTPPIGTFLAGFPSRREGSTGVADPLMLRIVALEDEAGTRLVLVTSDLLKWPRDLSWRTKLWAERELGLPSAALILNTSHTHSAPTLFLQRCYPHWPLDPEYLCRVEQSIRKGIAGALDDLRPTQVRFGMSAAHFGVNRRLPQPDGPLLMRPNEDGYYDPDLPVFVFERNGEPVAVLYSYACHPTSRNTLEISADWPGQVARGLREELGAAVMPLFAQGAGASIMPRVRLADGEAAYVNYWRDVAAQIADFVRSEALTPLEVRLDAAEREFSIPYDPARLPTMDELLELADPYDTELPIHVRPANRSIVRIWARDTLELLRTGALPEGFRMHLTHWRLADGVQLLGMSGEVTAEVGRMVKDLFPDERTVFLGYCSYTDAYIPTAAMLPEGGHEALASMYFHERPAPFVPEIDEIVAREVRALVTAAPPTQSS